MPTSNPILTYQQRCHRQYNASVDLPPVYTYPDGNPIRPLPPVKTATGDLMIVGAYPSARFEGRPSVSNPGRTRLIPWRTIYNPSVMKSTSTAYVCGVWSPPTDCATIFWSHLT